MENRWWALKIGFIPTERDRATIVKQIANGYYNGACDNGWWSLTTSCMISSKELKDITSCILQGKYEGTI